jgi:ankyrin repeat protein
VPLYQQTEGSEFSTPIGTASALEKPLITAAQHSACRVVAKLVQLGAEVNERDYQGNTALHYTVLNASEKTVVILSMSGADVTIQNSDGQTVIHLLAFSHDNNLAKHVCHSKNSIAMDMKDHDGLTPFMAAVMKGNLKIIQCFLFLGQGPEERMKKNKTPLHLAVE